MRTLLALLIFASAPAWASTCFTKDEAAEIGAKQFLDYYVNATFEKLPDEFAYKFHYGAYPETLEGAKEAFFSDDHLFNGHLHQFESRGLGSEFHTSHLYVEVECDRSVWFTYWIEN